MVIGLVIIILSPSFSLGNILSNTSPTSRPSSKPAAPNASSDYALQWTCKRCGRKNTGNGNFCSSCGEQNPTKLFCPNCGKPVAVGDVFCMYCHTKLSKDLDGSTTVGDNSSPVTKTPARGNFTRYQGFWQWYVNSARIPQWELTISTVFSTSFVFSLMHKMVLPYHYKLPPLPGKTPQNLKPKTVQTFLVSSLSRMYDPFAHFTL